jgi:hypothetical protein
MRRAMAVASGMLALPEISFGSEVDDMAMGPRAWLDWRIRCVDTA